MGKVKCLLVLAIVAATAISISAQQTKATGPAMATPVPAWPADGVIPADLKDHYVFVDTTKNQYVVAYPENLGSPNFAKDGPAQREVSRYPMQTAVAPTVLVGVTPTKDGKYKYAYTIADGPAAKGSIEQWVVALSSDAGNATAEKAPAGWFGVVQKGRKLAVANPDWIKTGAAAVFSEEKTDEQIPPGSKKTGFEVDSTYKPGFSIGYFRQADSTDGFYQQSGDIPTDVIHNATPPPPKNAGPPPRGGFGNQTPAAATAAWDPIKNEIDKVQEIEYNSKALMVLAPKFDQNATDKDIASDFEQGITAMSNNGKLSSDSPFVKDALSSLDAYVKAGGTGQLQFSSQPKGDMETEVFNAMKVSLHLK